MAGFNDFLGKAGAFATKAAGKAKDMAGVAAVKTKQVSRIAKLNMDISGQKDTIKKAYAALGKLYYEAHHDAPEDILAQVCQEIDVANAAIAAMEEEIAALKTEMAESGEDADFETVVEETAAQADVEVEVEVVEEPAFEAPAEPETPAEEPAPEAPAEPERWDAPAEPETSWEAPAEPAPEENNFWGGNDGE